MGRLPPALSCYFAITRRRQHEVGHSPEGDRRRPGPVAQLALSERGAARREDVWRDPSITPLLALSIRRTGTAFWPARPPREATTQGHRHDRRGPTLVRRRRVTLGMRGGVSIVH